MPDLFLMPGTEDGSDGGYDQDSPGGPAENGAGPFPVLSLDNQPPAAGSPTVAPAAGSDPAAPATPPSLPPPPPTPSVVATPDAAASPSPVIPAIPSPLPPPTPSPAADPYASEAEDPDPEARARAEEKAQTHFRQLFTDDSYLRWTADDPAVKAAAAANPDPNSVQIRGADQAYLAFRLGVPTGRLSGAAYTAQRDGYALAHFGRQGGVTDHEFFGLVRGEMQSEIEEEKAYGAVPEVIVGGWMDGLAAGHIPSNAEMMTRWRSQHPNLRLDAGEEARLMAAAQEASQPIYDFLSKYGRQTKLAYDTLKNFTDGKTTQPDGEVLSDIQVLSDLATQIGGMPDDARRQMYGYLGLYAQSQATTPEGKAAATKLWAKQFGESISRSITETAGAGELLGMQDEKTQQLEALQRIQSGEVDPYGAAGRFARPSMRTGRFRVRDVEGREFWARQMEGKVTPEERQKKIDSLQRDLRTIQVIRELRAVAAGEIDPSRDISKGWLGMAQRASYVAGSSLPYTAATIIQPEIGIPLVMEALSASETNRILLQNPRMPLDQARTMGMISAAAQTATMALTARLVVGRMPATAAFFKSLETPAVSLPGLFGRTALRTGIAAIEGGIQTEIGLATPMIVDGLAKAFGADVQGYDFKKKFSEFISPETQVPALISIAMVVAVGGGVAGLRDIKQFREIRQDPAKLRATFGIDAESARRVAEAPANKQDAILREAMARVSPETNRKLGEEAQKAAERAQAMQAAPDKPTINTWVGPDGVRRFSVEEKPGKEIYLTQDPNAALVAHGEALERGDKENAPVKDASRTTEGLADEDEQSEEGEANLPSGVENDTDKGDGNVQLSARESGDRSRSMEGRGSQPRAEVNSARRGFDALGVGEKIEGGDGPPRIDSDEHGNIVLIVHPDHFWISEGVADQSGYESGKFTRVILGEELLHAAHVVSVRNEWEAGGRKGSFAEYLRNDSHDVFQDIRDTIARVPEKERQELLETIRASYHTYMSRLTKGVSSHVDLETILNDIATKGDPVRFVAELLRQSAQIRKTGSLSEEVHADLSDTPDPGPIDGLVQRLAMWVRDAIGKMKATLPGVADGRFGRRAQDRLAKMEAVAAIADKAMEKDASHSKSDSKERSATNNDKEVGKDRSLDSNLGLEQQILSESPSSRGASAEDAASAPDSATDKSAPTEKGKPAEVGAKGQEQPRDVENPAPGETNPVPEEPVSIREVAPPLPMTDDERAEVKTAQERWWRILQSVAPRMAAQFELQVASRAEAAAKLNHDVPAEAQAAIHKRVIYLFREALEETGRAGNQRQETVRRLLHETAHAWWDTLSNTDRAELERQWKSETSEKTGPLYVDGEIRPDVMAGVESDVQEWFAERVTHANDHWAQKKAAIVDHDGSLLGKVSSHLRSWLFDGMAAIRSMRSRDTLVKEFRRAMRAREDLVSSRRSLLGELPDEIVRFAQGKDPIRVRDNAELRAIVDRVAKGDFVRNRDVQLGWTPLVFRKAGAKDVQISISESVIEKALGKHEIPAEKLAIALREILNPVLVVWNMSKSGRGHVMAFSRQTYGGQPIAAAIEFNKVQQRIIVNEVASVHPKTRFSEDFDEWNQKKLVIHIDPEKGKDWFRGLTGRDLPEVMNQSGEKSTSSGGNDKPRFAQAKPGMKLSEVGDDFPVDEVAPKLANVSSSDRQGISAEMALKAMPQTVRAADGHIILIHNPESGTLRGRGRHLVTSYGDWDARKAAWVPMIAATLQNAAVRLHDPVTGNKIYVRGYRGGERHFVITDRKGAVTSQGNFTGRLITQFSKGSAQQQSMEIDWIRPGLKQKEAEKERPGLEQMPPASKPVSPDARAATEHERG